jgi:hypothetical protein
VHDKFAFGVIAAVPNLEVDADQMKAQLDTMLANAICVYTPGVEAGIQLFCQMQCMINIIQNVGMEPLGVLVRKKN